MHRKIEELEKRWYRYKLKMIMIPLSSSIVTAFVGSGGYYIYDKHYIHNKPRTAVLSATKEVVHSEIEPVKVVKVESKDTKKDDSTILLEPIIPVIDLEKEEVVHYVKKSVTKRHTPNTRLVRAKANDYLTAKELSTMGRAERVTTPSKPHIIKRIKLHSTSANYIETMKEKYAHSHSSRDALLLAKAYYKKGAYSEAEGWALRANEINSKLEDSWLMFAKSKAKMGKKQEAINILAKYYTKSKSVKAKALIGQIKTGKI